MAMLKSLTTGLLLGSAGLASPAQEFASKRSVSGCDVKPDVALNERITTKLPSGREYLFWVPPSYDYTKETPLILSFHGGTQTPKKQADLDLLTTPHFNKDHIVVYPASGDYGGNYWQGAPKVPDDVDDVAYVLEILDEVEAKFCIDTKRVYATGKSQGGLMTNNLACDERSSARIAAFAPVSGAYYVDVTGDACKPKALEFNCSPARKQIPILVFHGGNDNTIDIKGGPRGGECLPDVPYFVKQWAIRDGLSDTPSYDAPLRGAGDNARRTRYETESEKGLVQYIYSGDKVDHQWPSTNPNPDSDAHNSPPATFNASSIIMDYFGKHTL
ncbi:Alpha/Beta hydrolase protein [Astrocystis sublimbata]|nr:Alpha/Beta hydrolase protein [Astrocystis sublimbata]